MMHKINVVLASIFTAVVMAVFPPVNCFSALAKWLDVRAMTLSAYPAATFIAARLMDSPMVEQAPYNPKNGISKSISPKDDAINCPNKSPANIYLMSLVVRPDFFKRVFTTSF